MLPIRHRYRHEEREAICSDPKCKKKYLTKSRREGGVCKDCQKELRKEYFRNYKKEYKSNNNRFRLAQYVPELMKPKATFKPMYRNNDIDFLTRLHFARTA